MQPIAIYGAGGLGKEILILLHQINLSYPQWQIIGFFDDDPAVGNEILSLPLLGGMRELNEWREDLNLIIAIGNPRIKQEVFSSINNTRISFPVLKHPSVQIEPFQQISIGRGSVIAAGNILTTGISIGEHVLLNLSCTVGHEVGIGNFTSLMPGCHLSGNVTLGEKAYIGSGAVLINGVRIGDNATVGAGAVVIKNIEPGATEVGGPSRAVNKNTQV